MTSFPKSYRYQLPPMLVYRLQLAIIGIWYYLSRLFSKLYAAIETLGGKAHYIISFLQEATTVNNTFIFV